MVMTRRIVRTSFQLGTVTFIICILLFLLDNRYRVLPPSLHNHLPVHHPGLVITDISVTQCSSLSLFSKCQLDPSKWHRIEKDLYLGKGWLSSAWVHVQRKKEEELDPEDRVVFDVKIGRLDPGSTEKKENGEQWESRQAGVWLKRTASRHASDSHQAATAVDVLFGADAVEPRAGWEMKENALLLNPAGGEHQEARLTLRKGPPQKFEKPVPRIRKDGKFKIMQVADLHLSTGLGKCRDPEPPEHNGGRCDADTRTLDFIHKLVDQEKPDIAILTGDQVNGETAPDSQSAVYKFAETFISRKVPFATIFGNHDDEGSLPRAALMSITEALPYSLSQAGPTTVDGVGNYYVEVLGRGNSKHSALTLYLLDTHGYSPDEKQFKGYDWLKNNQIGWFKDTAQRLKKDHKEYTHVHMDLAFIHIPLPEYRDPKNVIKGGQWREPPTAPGFNSGFRDALVEEGVLAVSCGHDHANDYCALSKNADNKPGLWMCYGGGSGFGGYGGYNGYHRRVRFFDVDINEARIKTYTRLEYGDTEKRVDEIVLVEGGRLVEGRIK